MARAMSSGLDSSSGEWLMPPFRLRTKIIPVGTPAAARIAASWPAPETSSRRVGRRGRERLERRAAHRRRLGQVGRLEADRRDEPVELGGVRRARLDRERDARGHDVDRARLDVERGRRSRRCRAHGARDTRSTYSAASSERVRAGAHRRRAGVVGAALEDDLAARDAGDRGDDPDRLVRALEHGALLDVQLEVGVGQLPRGGAVARRRTRAPRRGTRRRSAERRAGRRARARRRRRARRRSGRRRARSRGASRSRRARRRDGRRCCRRRRARPRARPRASSARRAGERRPPRATRRCAWR